MGAMVGVRATDGAAPAGMTHHQPGAHHGVAHHGVAHHGDGNQDADGGCHCTCIGDCSAAVALPTAPSAPTLRVALVAAAPSRPLDIEPARPTSPEPDRLLPFANGPPATALS
jgi:hypothetical protein